MDDEHASASTADAIPASCDQDLWNHLLTAGQPSPNVLDWMIRQATGWPNYRFATRGSLLCSLLASPIALSTADLHKLTGGDGIDEVPSATALLAHPHASMHTVTSLAGSLMSSWGGPRFKENAERQTNVIEHLVGDERLPVSQAARLRRLGLRPWAQDEHKDLSSLRDVRAAQRQYAVTMVQIARYGPAAWQIVAAAPQTTGPSLLTLVIGVLGEAPTYAVPPPLM